MYKVGDILTNGINYWLVWRGASKGCPECSTGNTTSNVVPVAIENGEIDKIYFDFRHEYWFNKSPNEIKPYARKVGENFVITKQT